MVVINNGYNKILDIECNTCLSNLSFNVKDILKENCGTYIICPLCGTKVYMPLELTELQRSDNND